MLIGIHGLEMLTNWGVKSIFHLNLLVYDAYLLDSLDFGDASTHDGISPRRDQPKHSKDWVWRTPYLQGSISFGSSYCDLPFWSE